MKVFTSVVPLSLMPYLSLVFFIFSETPLMNFLISWNYMKTTVSKVMFFILRSSVWKHLIRDQNEMFRIKNYLYNMKRETSKLHTHTKFTLSLLWNHKLVAAHEKYGWHWIKASFLSTHWKQKTWQWLILPSYSPLTKTSKFSHQKKSY